MLLNLTDQSSESLQSQIVRKIRAKILNGDLPAEENLESIRALAKNQRISVITVQRAYESLVREGLIHSRRGKGFFVSELPDDRKKDLAKQGLIENLLPIINSALADGLSADDIGGLVRKLLFRKNDDYNN